MAKGEGKSVFAVRARYSVTFPAFMRFFDRGWNAAPRPRAAPTPRAPAPPAGAAAGPRGSAPTRGIARTAQPGCPEASAARSRVPEEINIGAL